MKHVQRHQLLKFYSRQLCAFLFVISSTQAYGPAIPVWNIVNDTVMGGRSSSKIINLENGGVRFLGRLSLENNGGFASIRSVSSDYALPLSGEILLEVRGDGRTYSMNLRMNLNRSAFSYRQSFQTIAGETIKLSLPLNGFQATSYGRPVQASPLNGNKVQSIGFILADKREGPFQMEILSIDYLPGKSLRVESPAQLIEMAIARGVPMFNRGDHDACADIYDVTIHALKLMSEQKVSAKIKDILLQTTSVDPLQSDQTARAWKLRKVLDSTYDALLILMKKNEK